MSNYHVMAVGNALVDHEYAVSDEQLTQTELTKGNMTLVSHQEQVQLMAQFDQLGIKPSKLAGGGSAANSMYAFANLGGKAFYACRVADDGAGQFYLQDLQASKVTTSSHAVQHDEVTGSCVVCTTPDGERTMQTYLGTSSEINEQNIDFEVLKDSEWLYLEGYLAMSPSMNTGIQQLRQQAKDHNVKVAVSFADPAVVKFAKEGLDHMLGISDSNDTQGVELIFCNAEEAQLYTNTTNTQDAVRALLTVCQTAVVTAGAKGVIIGQQTTNAAGKHNGIGLITVPITSIENPSTAEIHSDIENKNENEADDDDTPFLDTLGAGDNFAGAFMYALTQNHPLKQCAHFANMVAGKVVKQFGPRLEANQYQALTKHLHQ